MKLLGGLVGLAIAANTNPDKPNVLFILSDDQGFSDVSWKNDKVKTPNLDRLRRTGMTIDGAYSQSRCSPSRVALMTGKYPWKIGVGEHVFQLLAKNGIRPKETLLPELLKNAGYDTHMYGKWHLGYCDEALLPTNRGFDTFHGFWGSGGIKYYDHQPSGPDRVDDYWVNDQQRQSSLYSTDEFTNDAMNMLDERQASSDTDPFFAYMAYNAPHSPYEVPDNAVLAEFDNISNAQRKTLLSMIYRMDTMVGSLITKLEKTGELENTVIIFQSDNGPASAGSSFPLRGKKSSYAEGGVRVPSFIVGPNIPADTTLHRTSFLHLTDWAPTILDYAGVNANNLGIDFDGHSFKGVFEDGEESPRTDLFHIVDSGRAGVYRKGDFKLAYKYESLIFSQASGDANHTAHDEGICGSMYLDDADYTYEEIFALSNTVQPTCLNTSCKRSLFLFNIREDPYELVNVYDQNSAIGDEMMQTIMDTADAITESSIDTNDVTDQATLNHAKYPMNTGYTSSGWCDASTI